MSSHRTPTKTRTARSTGRGCSFMAGKIRPRARRPAAPSLTSWLAARFRRARACTCARAWRWAGRAIFFFPRKKKTRGSAMCALRAAQFLLQKDSFSCRDAHAFNRYSSSQVTLCVCCSRFPLVSIGFSLASSLRFPSFHEPPVLVLFRFVADNSLARFVWNLSDAPKCCALDREARLSREGSSCRLPAV